MAKAADLTPERGKSTGKTAETAAVAKPRSRTTKRSSATKPSPAVAIEQPLDQLLSRVDALEEKIASSVSTLHTQLQKMEAEWQSMKDVLEAMRNVRPEAQEHQASQTTRNGSSPEEPSETSLPLVADLIQRKLTEQLSLMTTTLRRLEERAGFISNRLKPAPGRQGGQKQWRRDQRGDQREHFRSRGQGAARPGQGGQAWTPPSAASVQGRFAPRRYPSDLQVGEEEE